MFLFIQDNGVFGSIVVIAENEDDARLMMKDCLNYNNNNEIEKHSIEKGFVFYNLGDL